MNKEEKSKDTLHRVSGKRLRTEVERWDAIVARVTRSRLERIERDSGMSRRWK